MNDPTYVMGVITTLGVFVAWGAVLRVGVLFAIDTWFDALQLVEKRRAALPTRIERIRMPSEAEIHGGIV